jgi:hypothetical protein
MLSILIIKENTEPRRIFKETFYFILSVNYIKFSNARCEKNVEVLNMKADEYAAVTVP